MKISSGQNETYACVHDHFLFVGMLKVWIKNHFLKSILRLKIRKKTPLDFIVRLEILNEDFEFLRVFH